MSGDTFRRLYFNLAIYTKRHFIYTKRRAMAMIIDISIKINRFAKCISVTVASTLKTTKILETHISQLQGVSCDIDRTVVAQRKAV